MLRPRSLKLTRVVTQFSDVLEETYKAGELAPLWAEEDLLTKNGTRSVWENDHFGTSELCNSGANLTLLAILENDRTGVFMTNMQLIFEMRFSTNYCISINPCPSTYGK